MRQPPNERSSRKRHCHPDCFSLVIVATVLCGCSSTVPQFHLEFSTRVEHIKSVAVLPPSVAVYAGDSGIFLNEKSEAAHERLRDAIAQRFPLVDRWTMSAYVPENDSLIAEEFKTLRPYYLELGTCLPTPVLTLREAVDADAILITRAFELNWKDDSKAAQNRAKLAAGLLLHPSTAIATPMIVLGSLASTRIRQMVIAGGLAALQICLVDTRTGDELWSYKQEMTGADSLLNPEQLDTAVDEAFKALQTGLAK